MSTKKRQSKSAAEPMQVLLETALSLPNVEEGIACAGTSLEKRTIKVRQKAFLFLSAKDAMVKLEASLPAAIRLAQAEPERYKVGAHSWTTIQLTNRDSLPLKQLKAWVVESYQLFARAKK